jgi:hypothetical protein
VLLTATGRARPGGKYHTPLGICATCQKSSKSFVVLAYKEGSHEREEGVPCGW